MNINKILVGEKFCKFFHKNRLLNSPLTSEMSRLKSDFATKYSISLEYITECYDLYINSLYSKV